MTAKTSAPARRLRTNLKGAAAIPADAPPPVHNFRPIRTRRTFEEICERIREQLALGALKPGDKLPAERELAAQLGVSRNVLREALRSLEMAGILELRKGVKGGAFVREGDIDRMDVVMRDMLSLGTITIKELSDARIHILDLVVRMVCSNGRTADFRALEKNIDETEQATREARMLDRVECSREFYKILGSATGNKVIATMVQAVTEIHMRFVYAKVASSGVSTPKLVERRRELLAALRARDVALAARLMRTHLEALHRTLEADPGAMSLQIALAEFQQSVRR